MTLAIHRIGIDETVFNQLGSLGGERWFPLDEEAIAAMWMPQLTIENVKAISPFASMQDKKTHVALTRDPDLRFYHEMHAGVTINCPMDFTKFPFDSHVCYFEVCKTNVSHFQSTIFNLTAVISE